MLDLKKYSIPIQLPAMKTKKSRNHISGVIIAISVLLITGMNAKAQLTQVENLFGKYSISVDGCENNSGSGIGGSCPITINKPVGAYLYKAYLLASQCPIDTGPFSFTTPLRVNTTNNYAGSIAPALLTFATSGSSSQLKTRYDNVTTALSALLNGLPTGANTLYLIPDDNQPNDAGGIGLEGRALLVIWNDPNGSDKVISVALGSTTSLPATTLSVNTPPLNIAAANSTAIAGLGISFSLGDAQQENNFTVNSTLITTHAGGYDDASGSLDNGMLFTIGDDADALGLYSEKYDIKSALVNASTSYNVTFENVQGHEYDYFSVYYSVVSDAFQSGTLTGTLYTDANTNFIFDAGETGLPANITVDLYRDIDGTPGLNTATDQLVATTVTNASGEYTFTNITVNNNYIIQVNTADPDIPPALAIETTNPVLNVAVNNAATSTVDFGFAPPCAPAVNFNSNAAICLGQTYQLPWGPIVNTTGMYADTIRTVDNDCDSIITSVNLSVFSPTLINTEPHICPGQTYQLPWGQVVNTAGMYADTIRSQASCDSIIKTVHLIIDQVSLLNTEVHICPGQTYQLPSGTIVSIEGIYPDTLRSLASCDSIINNFHLVIDRASFLNTEVHICPGQIYHLPSGTVVSIEGIYIDTLRSQASCDSIINTISLMIDHAVSVSTEGQICSNQSYQLPSGAIVTAAGQYIDTLRSQAFCDSIISNIHLIVNAFSSSTHIDSIYEGQPYVLPSGITVNSAGTYQSVLVNSLGCDSIITTTLTPRKTLDECITRRNAITPNGDGINDYWILYRYRCFKKLAVDIYNRYGSPVYHSDDYQNDWNGKYKNKELPDGTYYYILNITTYDGKVHVFRDNVTILR